MKVVLFGYPLSDIIPFSGEVYLRFLASFQERFWPWQGVAILTGLSLLYLLFRSKPAASFLLLALGWAFVGMAFHLHAYSQLLWTARYFAWGFLLQAGLLGLASLAGGLSWSSPGSWHFRLGAGLAVAALFLHPVYMAFIGSGIGLKEYFGMTPDATALVSLGMIMAISNVKWRRWLALIPILWCLFSVVFYHGLGLHLVAVPLWLALLLLASGPIIIRFFAFRH